MEPRHMPIVGDYLPTSASYLANIRILPLPNSCLYFCATKGTITPIVARAELRMHLRHQSFQGLILE